LFAIAHDLPADTHLYGESFQMLSQTAGTLGKAVDLGYSERTHYKLPQPGDAVAVSGLVTLTPPGGSTSLLAFSSCKRFNGRFYLRDRSIEVVMDMEGLEIAPNSAVDLEEFLFTSGNNRADLLTRLASEINRNHPPRKKFPSPPTGWCSWYCFGPKVTSQDVLQNLDTISKDIPSLRYVQIDDGYQPAMGDWLETGKAFGGVPRLHPRDQERGRGGERRPEPTPREQPRRHIRDHAGEAEAPGEEPELPVGEALRAGDLGKERSECADTDGVREHHQAQQRRAGAGHYAIRA